jgi:catechol 2,3-dioxygenase-like lactoylglutathione lyase family enzyme
MTMVKCLSRVEMISGNPHALAAFYRKAFGFTGSARPASADTHSDIRMRLGKQEIALVGVEPQGRQYPADVAGWSPLFQHIAIVVSDMATAYTRLCAVPGWSPISTAGPQLLPPSSGSVSAFKFRDPEGHPLELIAFAADAIPTQWQMNSDGGYLGIDHSAVSVASTAESIAFYQGLGLTRSGGSLNTGPEQVNLDDVANAVVEVTALTPTQSTPHVELLCYRGDFDRHMQQRINDIAATRLVFSVESRAVLDVFVAGHTDSLVTDPVECGANAARVLLRDPDGHLIWLETEA